MSWLRCSEMLLTIVVTCSHSLRNKLTSLWLQVRPGACADEVNRDWKHKQLVQAEHDFAIDSAIDTQVPVRKAGRVMKLTHRIYAGGRNLMRSVQDMAPMAQHVADRDISEHVQESRHQV